MADVARDLPLNHDSVLTANVRQTRIARVYAEALYALAERDGRAADAGTELDTLIRDVLDKHPQIGAFFANPALTRRSRGPILTAALSGHVSPLLANFIGVLNQNNRLDLLRPIAAAYNDMLDQRAGRIRVSVRSAVPLDDGEQDRIRQTLGTAFGKQPVLSVRVDPELLGGLVVQVGDKVYDSSVRSRLEALRTQLLAGSSNVTQA
jgi:F-type H+-transporting ATPase subunit delta